jgi:hypothetical protein
MWHLDPDRDLVEEHESKHHTIGSALIVLCVVGLLLFLFG